jgi:RNA recognition motif-containing protein
MPPKANAKKSAPAAKAAKKDTKKAAPKKVSSGKGNGVYVKGLNFPGMNKTTIAEAFTGSFGAVEEVRLRNKKGGKSYTLVFFKNPAHAAKAIEYNARMFKGSKINVEAARADSTPDRATFCTAVYVGNLPGGMRLRTMSKNRKAKSKKAKKGVSRHVKLADIFKGCGKTVKARAYSNHGFVFFDSVAAAKEATKKDGLAVAGRKISVKLSVKTPAQLKAKAANAKTLAAAKKTLRVKVIEARRKRMKDVHRKLGQEAAARAAKRKIYRQ